MAGLLVTVSDLSGPIGTAKEAFAVVKGVIDAAAGTSNELIKAIAEGVKAQGGRPDMPDLGNDRAAVRTTLIDGCKRALAIVSQKSPAEAEEYKQWLTSLAQKTAEASKEGGFLGIGGVQISVMNKLLSTSFLQRSAQTHKRDNHHGVNGNFVLPTPS